MRRSPRDFEACSTAFSSPATSAIDAKGAKDLVISGGYNIYPAIKAAIEAVPGADRHRCPACRLRRSHRGHRRSEGGAQIDEEKIQAAIAGRLAKYKQLKRVFVTSDATRWARIQKKDLRETYKGTFASR